MQQTTRLLTQTLDLKLKYNQVLIEKKSKNPVVAAPGLKKLFKISVIYAYSILGTFMPGGRQMTASEIYSCQEGIK